MISHPFFSDSSLIKGTPGSGVVSGTFDGFGAGVISGLGTALVGTGFGTIGAGEVTPGVGADVTPCVGVASGVGVGVGVITVSCHFA